MMFSSKAILSPRFRCVVSENFVRFLKDPGVEARKKLMSVTNNDDVTDFEDLESDFMNVHKSYKKHVKELELLKEKEIYYLVKQKYFKEKFPNFLTWHDKEQIRYLHQSDPQEWTIERLSEGFPALPETIKKIVKSHWTKSTQNKITNHDNSVKRNWKLFKGGDMPDLPEDLIEHLSKFTNRALLLKPFIMPDTPKASIQMKNNVRTEFSDIITTYEKMQTKDSSQRKQIIRENYSELSLHEANLHSSAPRKNMSEDNFKKKITTDKTLDEQEKVIMNLKSQQNVINQQKTELIDLSQNKYQGQIYKVTKKDHSHLNYPEKITIPKNMFKKGFIYKLNDCYYDDDGEFLYRVPGMG